MSLRRKILGTTGRSVAYLVVGVVACGLILSGLGVAWREARQSEALHVSTERPRTVEREAVRHVPPLPVTYPFY